MGPLLFGDVPNDATKPKRKKKDPQTDGAVRRLTDLYVTEFKRKHNCDPIMAYGRDCKALKEMKDAWGEDATAVVIQQFFRSKDPKIVFSNYSIADLRARAQRLRIEANQHQRTVVMDDRTQANMDAAMRATQRHVKSTADA